MEKNRLKNGAYDFIILANRWLWTLPANKPSIAPECRLEYSDQVWRHQTLMTCGGLSKWLRSSVDQDPLTHVWSLTLIRVSIEIILFALTNHLEVNLTNFISHLESFWTSVFFFFSFSREVSPTVIHYLNFIEGSIPARTRAAQNRFIPSTLLQAKNSSDSPAASFHSSVLQLLQFQSGEGLALLKENAHSIADWAFPSKA